MRIKAIRNKDEEIQGVYPNGCHTIGGINSLMTQENFPELKDTPTEHTCELYKLSNAERGLRSSREKTASRKDLAETPGGLKKGKTETLCPELTRRAGKTSGPT